MRPHPQSDLRSLMSAIICVQPDAKSTIGIVAFMASGMLIAAGAERDAVAKSMVSNPF